MRARELEQLSDHDLPVSFQRALRKGGESDSAILAHIAEIDRRQLYLRAGYASLSAYCLQKMRLSVDGTGKRIQAARKAAEIPELFDALADGRLTLTAVVLLAPHLNRENAGGLITAAAGKTKAEIVELLATRFPRSEMLPLVETLPSEHALAHVRDTGPEDREHAPAHAAMAPSSFVKPHAAKRYALHLVIDQSTHDRLRYAQELLGHQVPSGDVAQVVGRALEALIRRLEKRKFSATERPRAARPRRSANPRHVPAHVRRAVWERDGGRCTFVAEDGHRCEARGRVEFDHTQPIARGGEATIPNLRLLCRAHNQHQAERVFGRDFMRAKREEARRAAAEATRRANEERRVEEERLAEEARARAVVEDQSNDTFACLRNLGVRVEEARRVVQLCATLPVTTLEERVREALRYLGPKTGGRTSPAPA